MEALKQIVEKLIAIVGKDYVLTDKTDIGLYDCDAETLDTAAPDIVVLPATTEQVAAVVKLAAQYKVPISPRGAGTGLSGGSTCVRGGISLVLTRMNRVLHVDPHERLALVEAGATNVSVSQAAAKHNLYFAPDPSSQIASTIGGNIAENAGGPHTLKYGMTTHHISGLKVVLADGSIVTLGGAARTSNEIDFAGFFIGSEGTLGIACEALVKLIPRPERVETLLAYFQTVGEAGQAVSDIVAAGVIPAAMEMVDKLTINAVEDYLAMGLNREAAALLIIELDGPSAAISAQRKVVENCLGKNGVISLRWALDAKERATIWKARKTAFGALGRIAPHGYVLDGVIPRSRLAEVIAGIDKIAQRLNLTIANVYHAGDGNLHPCMLYHRENEDEVRRVMLAGKEILELCVERGGTLSGEHGIGIEKMMEMPLVFSALDLAMMGRLKEAFDPHGILNPGKVIPNLKTCGESGARPLLRHKIMAGC
ncbi:FAD-linked oxidase C-terminal domain-containing protein [soil metagenome]